MTRLRIEARGTLFALAGAVMKAPRASLLFSLLGLSAACSNLADSVDPTSMGIGSSSSGGKSSHAGASSGGHSGSGTGGASSRGGNAGRGGSAGEVGGGVLSLATVDAHVIGRNGNSIRFTVTGTQPASKVSSISVSFQGADGMPVSVFDSDFDGVADSADGRIVLDALPTDDSFTATATMTGIANASKLARASVALADGDDNQSAQSQVTIAQQASAKLGDPCDPLYVDNRCELGNSCSGTPTVCSTGVAPVLQELAYLRNALGPQILVRGVDPDDDMGKFHIELLDASNQPVTVDTDSGPTTAIDTTPSFISNAGAFYHLTQGGLTLDPTVPKVRVTPIDSLGHEGTSQMATLATLQRAGDGNNCDARGFVGCPVGDACTPGLPVVVGRCAKLKGLHQAACTSALALDPANGVIIASGVIDGSSLWDPPSNCTNPQNVGRPEGVVRLHLAAAVATLTLSTRRPETNVDTVLYLLPGCADDSTGALGCNDDAPVGGFASELTLSKVAAGDYTVVIESGQLEGGNFGLSVATE